MISFGAPDPQKRAASGRPRGAVAWRREPEGKGVSAGAVRLEIGARLPGRARERACRGQAGAARFVAGQTGQEKMTRGGARLWDERVGLKPDLRPTG